MIDWSEPTLTSHIRENQKIYTEFLDLRFAENLVKHVLDPLDQCYFRSEFVGFEPFPERNHSKRPLIFASNHSGMAFPWDAIVFAAQLFKRNHYDFANAVRPLSAPMLSQSTLMNPFLVQNFWKRVGSVEANSLNFETMMFYEDSNLLVYPEGVPGIGKGFDKRYQLQRFATSFIRISLKYKADIIPFATVNGEYINPFAYNSTTLNKTVNKVGIPFLPVGLMTLLIPFQPWLFYFGFPAKLTYVMGKRLKPYEMIDKPLEKITEEEVRGLTETVRQQMQAELNEAVSKHGAEPYAAKEFFAACRKNAKKFPYFLPFFWPSLFTECERRVSENDGSDWELTLLSGLKTFLKRPLNFAFFLPIIGWLPILWRGYRRRP
jgi:1-acyl-sn-glycerol-3-phosphate acyltransferase